MSYRYCAAAFHSIDCPNAFEGREDTVGAIENTDELGYSHSGGQQCLFLSISVESAAQNSKRFHTRQALRSCARTAQVRKLRNSFPCFLLPGVRMENCQTNPALALVERPAAECAVNKEFARTIQVSCSPDLTSVFSADMHDPSGICFTGGTCCGLFCKSAILTKAQSVR